MDGGATKKKKEEERGRRRGRKERKQRGHCWTKDDGQGAMRGGTEWEIQPQSWALVFWSFK